MATDTFSGNGNYYLDVNASLVSQSVSGNYSTISWYVRVYKTFGSGFYSGASSGNNGNLTSVAGTRWNGSGFAYDFRNVAVGGYLQLASGTFQVAHDANGNGAYWVSSNVNLVSIGNAATGTGSRTLPKINRVPPAPTPLSLDMITPSSIRYRFQSNGGGGGTFLEWQIGYGLSATTPQLFMASGGTSVVPGLQPNSSYYFWSRGRNTIGWGPWSTRMSAKTLPGMRIKVGGVWKDALPMVKVNGVWKIAAPLVKVNGVWKTPV